MATFILSLAGCAAASAPYPRSSRPTSMLYVYSEENLMHGDLVSLETLGGGLARDTPRLYRVPTTPAASDSYSLWLSEMRSYFGVIVNDTYLTDPAALLAEHRDNITGVVRFDSADGASVNAALTYVAGQASSDLLVAASTPATLSLLDNWGKPLVFDTRGMDELQAYHARGASRFSGKVVSFQLRTQYSNLAEYAVFARAPTIEYACTGVPNISKCFAENGYRGGPAAEQVVFDMAKVDGVKVALGWGPESDYVAILGENGIYVHASDNAHDVTPVTNAASHAGCRRSAEPPPPPPPPPPPQVSPTPITKKRKTHKVAFLMSDGDNLQWMFNNFVTDPDHWWGSPDRGRVKLGWTISPALVEVGPVILEYLARTKSENDDFIGAPSGLGYIYPSVWKQDSMAAFAALTGLYLNKTSAAAGRTVTAINVIGDPCVGGSYVPGCKGMWFPNMSSLEPILAEKAVDGLLWYTFGAGYSGWSGTKWGGPNGKKPVVGGRISLWGDAKTGSMLDVTPLARHLETLLFSGKINVEQDSSDGYSLIPVHAWSHNVTDVVQLAGLLEASGNFEIISPTELLRAVAKNVIPPAAVG